MSVWACVSVADLYQMVLKVPVLVPARARIRWRSQASTHRARISTVAESEVVVTSSRTSILVVAVVVLVAVVSWSSKQPKMC